MHCQTSCDFSRIHTDADAHVADEQWGFGDWHEAGGSGSGWLWDQPCDGVQAQRNMSIPCGETAALGMEVENLKGAVSVCRRSRSMSKRVCLP